MIKGRFAVLDHHRPVMRGPGQQGAPRTLYGSGGETEEFRQNPDSDYRLFKTGCSSIASGYYSNTGGLQHVLWQGRW